MQAVRGPSIYIHQVADLDEQLINPATEETLREIADRGSTTNPLSAADALPNGADYRSVTSYDAFDNPLVIVYKKGGAGGTTVATDTFTYDAQGRFLTSART
jgi:hypothetical protein